MRVPPLIATKKPATAQTMTARVISHPLTSCHTGSVKRKKVSGLPKIGSTAPDAAGACQYTAKSCQSAIIAVPVPAATTNAPAAAISRNTGSTGSLIGCPLMRIGRPASSPSRAGFNNRYDPYRTRKVTRKKPVKISARRLSVFQKTSAYPSDPNQSAST